MGSVSKSLCDSDRSRTYYNRSNCVNRCCLILFKFSKSKNIRGIIALRRVSPDRSNRDARLLMMPTIAGVFSCQYVILGTPETGCMPSAFGPAPIGSRTDRCLINRSWTSLKWREQISSSVAVSMGFARIW